jgi:predicted neutral ceramidase superfamily lipid hydrolase
MKASILKFALPLTILSLGIFTKWWYVLPDDAPDIILWGYPLPFIGDGFHTSMSIQVFTIELIFDFMVHLSIWLLIVSTISRFLFNVKLNKVLTPILIIASGLFFVNFIYIAYWSNPLFHIKRPFDMETRETGYKFIWEVQPRPDYNKSPYKIQK